MTKQTSNSASSNPLNTVQVSATFTAEPIQPLLALIIQRLALPLTVELSPYHQVFQQLLDPFSASSQNAAGINLWLIRIEDFVRDLSDDALMIEKATGIVEELTSAFGQFSARSKASSVVLIIPSSPRVNASVSPRLDALSQQLSSQLAALNGTVVLNVANDASFNAASQYDAQSDDLAHIPFTEQGFASLAMIAARKLHMLKTTAKKVLILDCDNTIWRGVVGEDGVASIGLERPFLALQQFAVDVQQQGVLVCLASKNVEADVMEVFAQRADMVLKAEHIVAHRVNWQHKYQNLESLASELNLGLDSFVFVDDNPVECGQMRSMLPQVLTIQLPAPDAMEAMLKQLWVFDKLSVTEEDAKRTQMYRENSARQQLESSATDIGAFLASLELNIDIGTPSEDEIPRVAQLTQRTNQFNFTTVRRNENDMRVLMQTPDCFVLKVNVKDRFGDYGLVGDMIALKQGNQLMIDTFLLSCRVLGRGVEHAMLRHLATLAKQLGCTTVELPFIKTAKNEPARAFAEQMIGQFRTGDEANARYIVPADTLENTAYVPGSDPEAVLEAKRSETKKKPAAAEQTASQTDVSERYEFLLNTQTSDALVKALAASKVRQRDLGDPLIKANNSTEQKMLDLWQNVLGVHEIGMEDNYFALGGTSLMAAQLFAEISRSFDAKLRLTVILDAPTPKALLAVIQSAGQAPARGLIKLKTGGKRTLFMVHDGDGETLLYLNLAKYLPSDMTVIGVEPHALPNIPMAHTSIEAMAAHYIKQIQQQQPTGPYYLGGMCAGGLIAYVMGHQLKSQGQAVHLVAMLDSATPHARKIAGLVSQTRLERVKQLLQDQQAQQSNPVTRVFQIGIGLLKKVFNTLHWEIYSRYQRAFRALRFAALKRVLSKQTHWPTWLKPMSVREIYNSAENACVLPKSDIPAVLVRASAGAGDDVPYQFVYAEPAFGWQAFAQNLTIADTPGGHASMLQEPHAQDLAKLFNQHIQQ